MLEDVANEKEVDKSSNDALSIRALLLRRITSAEPDTDLLNDKEYTTGPRKCCIKRVKSNMERALHHLCEMAQLRKIQKVFVGQWKESDILLFDRIASEIRNTLRQELRRIRHSEHWILKLNQDGPQQPLNQRPDDAQAKRKCKMLHDECLARTQQEYRTIPRSQQVRTKKRTTVRRH